MNRILFLLFFSQGIFCQGQNWCQKANYPGGGRIEAFGFEVNKKLYVGCGVASGVNYNDFWEYDPYLDTWNQITNFPGSPRRSGVSFSINGFGYVGLGFTGTSALNSLYRYNPVTNNWSQMSNYNGAGGRGSFVAVLNGKAYVGGGGQSNGTSFSEFWSYDPITDSWTQISSNWPLGNRMGGIGFSDGTYLYFGFGHNNSNDFNDLWRYDPSSNQWIQMASLPNGHRFHPVVFKYEGDFIVGGGRRLGPGGALYNDYNEYDPITNTWTTFPIHANTARWTGVGLSTANYGYVISGTASSNSNNSSQYLNDVWEFGKRISEKRDTLEICDADSLILTSPRGSSTYTWQNGSSNSTFIARSSGFYWVRANQNGCIYTDSIQLYLTKVLQLELGNDTTLCQGNDLNLDATNSGATYLWQDNSTNPTFYVNQAGLYWVEVELNGCIVRDSILVSYQSLPQVSFGADTTLCDGTSLTLDASNSGATYQWQDNSTSSTYTVTQSGQYYVEVDLNGCLAKDTINVNYNPLPIVNLGNDTTLCDGETLSLDATNSAATYSWQDNSTASTFTVTQAGIYYVDVDLNGCLATDTIVVNYQSYPLVDLGSDTALCQGESLLLDATNSGATYAWQDNSTNSTFTVTQAGQYWVEVTTNGCIASDTINVTYNPLPIVNLGNDTTLCDGETLSLDATNSGATYSWQDNSTASTFTVTQAGTYYVEVDLNGCLATDTIVVNYQSYPMVDLGPDTALCQGESLILDATNSGATYEWQDNSTNSTFTVTQAGQYWIEVTTNGCIASDTINVTYNPLPTVNLGNDTTLCDGETLPLDASNNGATYSWQDNSTASTFTVTQAGTYYVEVDLNGCIATDTIVVNYQSYPQVDLGSDTAICQGESLLLDATNSGATYAWQDNSTNSTFIVTQAGQYWVEVTTNGCIASDTINVTYNPIPTVNLGNDATLCEGETLSLNANNNGATYSWQDNSTTSTFTVTQAGTYYVDVDLNGCLATDTIIVEYQGSLSRELVSDTMLCAGQSLTIDASLPLPAIYLWSDNSTNSFLTVYDSSIYWVKASTLCDTLVDSVAVSLKNCACNFKAPNVFTPNGDGINDFFFPNLNCEVEFYEMHIFNRWGDLVFYSNQPMLHWDGRMKNGKKVNEGYYSFIIKYKDTIGGETQIEQGGFMLIQ